MGQRLELQALFETLLGSRNVYFQPPPSLYMSYPCIMYKQDYRETKHANNSPYFDQKRYQVTVISSDPDSDIHDKVAQLPRCSYDRYFTADQLHHYVYNLFF